MKCGCTTACPPRREFEIIHCPEHALPAAALDEIARLRAENAELKRRVAELEEPRYHRREDEEGKVLLEAAKP